MCEFCVVSCDCSTTYPNYVRLRGSFFLAITLLCGHIPQNFQREFTLSSIILCVRSSLEESEFAFTSKILFRCWFEWATCMPSVIAKV